jgi:dTDP-4-dehydrorhamnose reductase
MKVIIVGAKGMLGTAVAERFSTQHETFAYGHEQLDIADFGAVRGAIEGLKPDWVINCAAITNVDNCEHDPLRAYRVNALGPWNLAAACEGARARLVHLSTDYVFDGTKAEPYIESDRTNPINAYGRSKLEGELRVRAVTCQCYIVRTAWLFGPREENFLPWVLDVGTKQSPVYLVDDQWGSPTYVADVAEGIAWLLEQAPLYGVYHLVNRGSCTRRQLGEVALRAAGIETPVEGIPMSALPRPARRPVHTPLRNWMLEVRGGWNAPPYQDAVERFMKAWLSR